MATEANTVSVGSASVRRRIVNVADARITASSTDAVTGKQLHAMNERVDGMIKQDSAGGVVRIANSNTGTEVSMRNAVLATRKVSGVSDGALTTTSTDAVNGRQLNTTNGNVTKAQTAADAAKADASKALAQVTTDRPDRPGFVHQQCPLGREEQRYLAGYPQQCQCQPQGDRCGRCHAKHLQHGSSDRQAVEHDQ